MLFDGGRILVRRRRRGEIGLEARTGPNTRSGVQMNRLEGNGCRLHDGRSTHAGAIAAVQPTRPPSDNADVQS